MKRLLLVLLVSALVAAFTLTSDTSYSKGPPAKAQPVYIAMGASYAFGVGATNFEGHTSLFRDFLESKDGLNKDLIFTNLSFPGKTSSEINAEQLPVALLELEARNSDKNKKNDVVVVTVSSGGGGNDLLQFLGSPGALPCFLGQLILCFDAIGVVLDTFEANFEFRLDALRNAAGPDTTIITQTFPNSFRRTGCASPAIVALTDGALEGVPGTSIADGLNDITRSAAAKHDVEVAEVFLPFFGNEDALITGDCIHPNDDGHALIADQFIAAFND